MNIWADAEQLNVNMKVVEFKLICIEYHDKNQDRSYYDVIH